MMIKPIDQSGGTAARMIPRRIALKSSLGAMLLVVSLGLGAGGPARAESDKATDDKVTIDNFTFTPKELTVKVGTTVTWTNQDDIPHSIVEKSKSFRSKALDTEDVYTFTFAQAGTYEYFCGLHPHMVGTIIVKP